MKILLVPTVTQRPRICSTMYLCWEIIENLIKVRDDVFFYLTYPGYAAEPEDMEYLSRYSDRVTLIDMPGNTWDRVGEIYMTRYELHELLHPLNRKTWDIDVVVTSQIPVLKHLMVHSSRPESKRLPKHRLYIGLEEMACLPFRDTVPWHEHLYADTLMSYALSDGILMNNQWTKSAMRPVLKEVFSPSWQKRVLDRVHEVNPVKLQRLKVREGAYSGGDFNVVFVGRITGTRNFGAVAELFRKQFSYSIGPNKDKVQFIISTNSESIGASNFGDLSFIDIQHNDRTKFHDCLNQQHVAVNLSTVEDFSLSTYETLLSGCPIIVPDYQWTTFLGPDYPFRVSGEIQAYAMLNRFIKDYSGTYQLFKEWEATWWKKCVEDPVVNTTTSEKLMQLIAQHEARHDELYTGYAEKIRSRLSGVVGPEVLNLNDVVFAEVPPHDKVVRMPIGRLPTAQIYKIIASEWGYKDTNSVGIMRKY